MFIEGNINYLIYSLTKSMSQLNKVKQIKRNVREPNIKQNKPILNKYNNNNKVNL